MDCRVYCILLPGHLQSSSQNHKSLGQFLCIKLFIAKKNHIGYVHSPRELYESSHTCLFQSMSSMDRLEMTHCTIAIINININIINTMRVRLSTRKPYLNPSMTLSFARIILGATLVDQSDLRSASIRLLRGNLQLLQLELLLPAS